jgi:hypothetical protein
MERVQQQYHVEDVGRILLQTQEELRQMRQQMADADVSTIKDILLKAEQDLRSKAEVRPLSTD